MLHNITLIPGDGVGPEITEATTRALEATGVAIEWDVHQIGEAALRKYGTPLPKEVLQSIKKNKVALKGPVTTPIGTGFRSVNVSLRQELDLYACLRPCKTYLGIKSRYKNIDIVVVRENTEDLYAGIEFQKGAKDTKELNEFIDDKLQKRISPDSGISIKPISEKASRRIVTFAFRYARTHGRKRVTCVHKANIMKFTDGLFLSVAQKVAKNYPDIQFDDALVDNLCMQLVTKPERYDIIVLPNLYGDIVSELCAGLVGGIGVVPSANIGDKIAVFEPAHGSAPKYAGRNKVNPMAMMLSASMMLKHIGEEKPAQRLERAIIQVISEGKTVTYDLKSDPNDPSIATTSAVADAVIKKLKEAR
ncbi:MAG TPA: isocitrate/isopropylmalate dehydrogenase family protein [Dehalococcoidia bacterium]|nr:isocitrate/isopropylmalate dehydrogenase family protein [Dehalococcoidia bacterium]